MNRRGFTMRSTGFIRILGLTLFCLWIHSTLVSTYRTGSTTSSGSSSSRRNATIRPRRSNPTSKVLLSTSLREKRTTPPPSSSSYGSGSSSGTSWSPASATSSGSGAKSPKSLKLKIKTGSFHLGSSIPETHHSSLRAGVIYSNETTMEILLGSPNDTRSRNGSSPASPFPSNDPVFDDFDDNHRNDTGNLHPAPSTSSSSYSSPSGNGSFPVSSSASTSHKKGTKKGDSVDLGHSENRISTHLEALASDRRHKQCMLEGELTCGSESTSLICLGEGIVDCRDRIHCSTGSDVRCNKDLKHEYRCRGIGFCRPIQHREKSSMLRLDPNGTGNGFPQNTRVIHVNSSPSSLTWVQSTIIGTCISLAAVVLIGVMLFAYITQAKLKIRPESPVPMNHPLHVLSTKSPAMFPLSAGGHRASMRSVDIK